MYRYALTLSIVVLTMLSACSNKQTKNNTNKYLVVNPLITDTSYERAYAATINSFQNVEIRNKVKGFIEEIYVDEGQKVAKGQVLFSLNSKELEQAISKTDATLQSSLAELKSVEIEFENTKKLFDKNIVSKSELDLYAAKVQIMKAKVTEAKVAKEQAQFHFEYAKIRAPFAGLINRIPHKKGSLVDEGSLLTSISNNEQVFAYFNVSEIDYLDYVQAKNKSNIVHLILANNSSYPHAGVIETTESEFDHTTGNLAFRAKFPNPEKLLKEGGTGKILVKSTFKKAILIPQKASFEVQGNIYVYVVDQNKKVSTRQITPILRLPNYFILRSGLSASDQVIFEGIQSVKEGDVVETKLVTNPTFS